MPRHSPHDRGQWRAWDGGPGKRLTYVDIIRPDPMIYAIAQTQMPETRLGAALSLCCPRYLGLGERLPAIRLDHLAEPTGAGVVGGCNQQSCLRVGTRKLARSFR